MNLTSWTLIALPTFGPFLVLAFALLLRPSIAWRLWRWLFRWTYAFYLVAALFFVLAASVNRAWIWAAVGVFNLLIVAGFAWAAQALARRGQRGSYSGVGRPA